MIVPTLEEVRQLSSQGKYRRIPLRMEIPSDLLTPILVLKRLKKNSRHCFMLDSAENSKQWGRYTFLGFDPVLELTCVNGNITITNKTRAAAPVKINNSAAATTNNSAAAINSAGHPKHAIRKILADYKAPKIPGMPPFCGGLVGYFSYDYIKYSEPSLKLNARDEEAFKDVDLMLFEKVIAFDNEKQTVSLIVNIDTEKLDSSYFDGINELEQLAKLICSGPLAKTQPLGLKSSFRQLFKKEEYMQMVEKGKEYIREGDIFQVVLSNRLDVDISGSLLDAYRILRRTNPSPYMFYFSSDDVEIAGASPETLVKLEDGVLHTFPLAGTRKRGRTQAEDEQLEAELLSDQKELAEHNMLVDLGRNDIGKISRFGSVRVVRYKEVERYSHVMHIASAVKGEIRADRDAADAIDAILPAGTLSGAPKLRACEIINELEDNKRGIYGGAIGYLDLTGNLDTCIAIRLAFAKNNKVFVRSGAGIVSDSVPELEYEECINKAQAVINALILAEGGIV